MCGRILLDKPLCKEYRTSMTNKVIQVQERLQRHQGQYQAISEETGLSLHWLWKFSQGKFSDPGALKIEKLEKWLNGHTT